MSDGIPVDRFRLVVESAPNGIIVVDAGGRVTLVNAQIEKMFGYERGELIGRPVEILLPGRVRGSHAKLRSDFSENPETRPMGAGRDLYGLHKNGTEFPVEVGLNAIRGATSPSDDLILATVVDITARRKAEDHIRFVMRELSHRTKNLMAIVQVMAWQTARTSTDLEDFEQRFTNRIDALTCSHNLLVKREWEGVGVEELVQGQLAPFLDRREERLVAHGPALLLTPNAAQNLGLALHELATNASKYGALACPTGKVEIGWTVKLDAAGERRFYMYWREFGGAKVEPPKRTGFGHAVITKSVPTSLGGEVEVEFQPKGLVWSLAAPADRIFGESYSATGKTENPEEIMMSPDLLHGRRILVVEDDALLAMGIEDMLRDAGAEVAGPVGTLATASSLAAEDNLSAAILDIRLNGDEVWPVARVLAESDVPFVFYTGHFDSSNLPAEWAQRPILTKPAKPKQVVTALSDLVTTH